MAGWPIHLGGDMDRINDEQLKKCIMWAEGDSVTLVKLETMLSALVELRERRAADKAKKDTPNWERPLPMFGAEGAAMGRENH
jgi:hypothetical protein